MCVCVCMCMCVQGLAIASATPLLYDPSLSGSPLPFCEMWSREDGRREKGLSSVSWCSKERRKTFRWAVKPTRFFFLVAFEEARERMEGAPGKTLGMSEGLVCGKKKRKSPADSSLQFVYNPWLRVFSSLVLTTALPGRCDRPILQKRTLRPKGASLFV